MPKLTNESLISIGHFCDNDCEVLFKRFECIISHNNQQILQGIRNHIDGLWDLPLRNKTIEITKHKQQHTLNYIISNDKTKTETEMAQYLYAALYSPCIKTLQKAIANGNLISLPVENLIFFKINQNNNCDRKGSLGYIFYDNISFPNRKYRSTTKSLH